MFSSITKLFAAKSKFGALALNGRMDLAQAHGQIWVPSRRWAGSYEAMPFKVEHPEGLVLKSNSLGTNLGSISKSFCLELKRMGYNPLNVRNVEVFRAGEPLIFALRPTSAVPQSV